MANKRKRFIATARNLYPTIARIVCIFVGFFMMGLESFFSFYFLHMILTSIIAFYRLDSDVDIRQTIRRDGSIGWQHLGYVSLLHLASSLIVLAIYWSFVEVFDRLIAPGAIDAGFAKLYALTIIGALLTPFAGIVREKGGELLQEIILRGNNVLTLALLLSLPVAGIDVAFVPYAWLVSSLALAAIRLALGLYYLLKSDARNRPTPMNRKRAHALWQKALSMSAVRTNKRVTFLAAKAAMSALLGPFAGLTLKAVDFNNDAKRRLMAAKVKRRWPLPQALRNLFTATAGRISIEQALWFTFVASTLAVVALLVLSGSVEPILLLGYLALSSRMLSVSLRSLLLRKLTS